MEDSQLALYDAYLWQSIMDIMELNEHWRAKTDPAFVNLLNCVRLRIMWDGSRLHTPSQGGNSINYNEPDYEVLNKRHLQYLFAHCYAWSR